MVKNKVRLAITTGDPDGIGTEIVSKSLHSLGPHKQATIYLWRSQECPKQDLRRLDKVFKRVPVSSWEEAQTVDVSHPRILVDIESKAPAPRWVEEVAQACMDKKIDAISTAPLSKTLVHDSGFSDLGHTDILRRVTTSDSLFMAFLGKKFSVLLCTDHIPLNKVPGILTEKLLRSACLRAHDFAQWFSSKSKPIALLGLNPHAGEGGLIGEEESSLMVPLVEKLRNEGINIRGPLVPDVTFKPQVWQSFSVFVCPYHDQGLIPFKSHHANDPSVHLTMGLPFIRTSVDHGTAKDLFGRSKADFSSMKKAIEMAIRLGQKRGSLK